MLGLLDRATKLTTPRRKTGAIADNVRQRLNAAVAEGDPQTWQRMSAPPAILILLQMGPIGASISRAWDNIAGRAGLYDYEEIR